MLDVIGMTRYFIYRCQITTTVLTVLRIIGCFSITVQSDRRLRFDLLLIVLVLLLDSLECFIERLPTASTAVSVIVKRSS